MSPRTRKNGTPRGERSKETILEAALPLFARQGYRGASLASIASAAGLTQPGLLHHFPSKEELLLGLLDWRDRDDGKRLSGLRDGDGLAYLERLEDLVAHNMTAPELVALFTTLVGEGTSPEHPAHDYFVERYRRIRARAIRSLREGQLAGEVRDDADLEVIVPLLFAVMDGLQIQWLLDPEIDMVASFDVFAKLVRDQLAAVPAQGTALS
jgi:AcrR family transcriptional regulator